MEKKDFIVWASRLQQDYKPSQEVLNQISQIELVAIVGPTGAGKSTIIERLGLQPILSDVTRAKRPGEKDGKGYHFREDYLQIIEEIKSQNYVQFLVSNSGEFYGTRASAYPQNGSCVMAIFASAIPHFQAIGFKKITPIYIMPPSYVEWMRRIGGVRTRDLLTRISEAKNSILQALDDDSYHFVLNDNIELALEDINQILNNQPVDEHRAMLATATADILLEHIGEND